MGGGRWLKQVGDKRNEQAKSLPDGVTPEKKELTCMRGRRLENPPPP